MCLAETDTGIPAADVTVVRGAVGVGVAVGLDVPRRRMTSSASLSISSTLPPCIELSWSGKYSYPHLVGSTIERSRAQFSRGNITCQPKRREQAAAPSV